MPSQLGNQGNAQFGSDQQGGRLDLSLPTIWQLSAKRYSPACLKTDALELGTSRSATGAPRNDAPSCAEAHSGRGVAATAAESYATLRWMRAAGTLSSQDSMETDAAEDSSESDSGCGGAEFDARVRSRTRALLLQSPRSRTHDSPAPSFMSTSTLVFPSRVDSASRHRRSPAETAALANLAGGRSRRGRVAPPLVHCAESLMEPDVQSLVSSIDRRLVKAGGAHAHMVRCAHESSDDDHDDALQAVNMAINARELSLPLSFYFLFSQFTCTFLFFGCSFGWRTIQLPHLLPLALQTGPPP
jgi:hypothetical protein